MGFAPRFANIIDSLATLNIAVISVLERSV